MSSEDQAPTEITASRTATDGLSDPCPLVTFDVFETVLVRSVSPHQEIFDRVGRSARSQGLVTCSGYAFARVREASEWRAATAHQDGMNLFHIYEEVGAALCLTSVTAHKIMAIEMEEEARSLRPLECVRPLLAKERRRAGRIVFVSDMYLSSDFIRAQLVRHGFWESGDGLYVSHHDGCSKRSGRLFEIVARGEGVTTDRITHYGNYPVVDVDGARKAGAIGRLVPAGNPNRYEFALQAHRASTDGVTASMAGASRLARTSVSSGSSAENALVEVSAGVVAPVLTSFVLWLFLQARARGLKRLYFISRDGEILLHIAERLPAALRADIELRYLYGSRLAWNSIVSSPTHNPHVWHSLMWFSSAGFTNRALLARTGLESAQIEAVTSDPVHREAWGSTSERDILRTTLARLEADGTLGACSQGNKDLLLRYLEQEGIFDGTPHAIVDVGWRGTQHDVLIEIQRERGVRPAHGLFLGLEQSGSSWGDLRSAFYFDARPREEAGSRQEQEGVAPLESASPISARGQPAPRELYTMFEMFCAGREGSLLAYREEDGRLLPVLDQTRAAEVQAWNMDKMYEAAGAFAANLDLDGLSSTAVDVRAALAEVIDLFWKTPTREEAEAWGAFPWEVGQGSTRSCTELAPPYELAVGQSSGRLGLHSRDATQWPVGSRMRGGLVVRTAEMTRRKAGGRRARLLRRSVAGGLNLLRRVASTAKRAVRAEPSGPNEPRR